MSGTRNSRWLAESARTPPPRRKIYLQPSVVQSIMRSSLGVVVGLGDGPVVVDAAIRSFRDLPVVPALSLSEYRLEDLG